MENVHNKKTHPFIPCREGIKKDKLLTVEQVAEYLQLSNEHVRKLCRLQQIPCIKLGGNWRFDKMDIDGWIGEKKQGCVDIRVVKNLRI